MTRILIISRPDDAHAADIHTALCKRGHDSSQVYLSSFPTESFETIDFDENEIDFRNDVSGELKIKFDQPFDVVWYRRPSRPAGVDNLLHPHDEEYVRKTLAHYHKSRVLLLEHSILDQAIWVNKVSAAERAESKPLQLKIAQNCGLLTSPTIISNNPERIRNFINQHQSVVCKSLIPYIWEDERVSNYAAIASERIMPSDNIVRLCPEIFQARVDRVAEWRVFVVGKTVFSVRTSHAEGDNDEDIDWRRDYALHPDRTIFIQTPDELRLQCFAVMDALDIITGSFDFIEDDKGKFVFLEVNQAGQFLFLEAYGVPALDAFVTFLQGPSKYFEFSQGSNPLSLDNLHN